MLGSILLLFPIFAITFDNTKPYNILLQEHDTDLM